MSFGFDLNEKTPDQITASGNVSYLDLEGEPDTFDNFGSSLALSVPQGFADMAKAGSVLMSAFPAAYDSLKVNLNNAGLYEFDKNEKLTTDAYFENVTELTKDAVNYWAPDASQTGSAGQIAGGLVRTLTQATAGGVGLATSMGVNESANLVEQGVDAETALKSGAITGAVTYAGFKLPFLGNSLLQKVSFGAGSNVALNAGSTAAQNQLLESEGYSEIADQYNPLDAQARLIDVLTGAAFGGIAHVMVGNKRVEIKESDLTTTEKAAILTANNAKHFQQDTAPGMPLNDLSSVAHQDALQTALNQISNGERVDLNAVRNLDEAEFAPRQKQTLAADEIGLNVVDDQLDSLDNVMAGRDVDGELIAANEAPQIKQTAQVKTEPALLQTPEFSEAKTLVESVGDLMVNLEEGDNVRSVRASDLLREIETEAKTIESDSKAFDAAITCYLGDA